MGLIDTHAHLDDKRFDEDRDNIINSLAGNGIDAVITIGDSIKSSRAAAKLAEDYGSVYAAAGVHPHNAKDYRDEDDAELERLCGLPKVAAVGEIGLDYHYDFSPRDVQAEVMLRQIALARRLGLPLVFHIREAWGDFLEAVRQGAVPSASVLHSFSGSIETARECLDRGMHLSFTGVVTFKNAKKVREAAQFVPLDRIMIETDCPYMAPEPHRGRRCEPKDALITAEFIAGLKGMAAGDFIEAAARNARRFFKIGE